ncbi:MAG: GvpL/GvpF family gas vesicle protein [Pseudomonadota bacterium]
MTSRPLHLHGIFHGEAAPCSDTPAHRIIALPAFNALVSDYALDPDTAKIPPDDLADAALEHHHILQAFCADHPLLPMRFGTLFSGIPALENAMQRERERYVRALQTLAGHREYSVEVLIGETVPTEPTSSATGRSFLSDRKQLRDLRRNISLDRQTFARDLLHRVGTVTAHPLHSGAPKPDKLLDVTTLLSEVALADLRRIAADADTRAKALGLKLRITGPWPAYHVDPDALLQEAACHGA